MKHHTSSSLACFAAAVLSAVGSGAQAAHGDLAADLVTAGRAPSNRRRTNCRWHLTANTTRSFDEREPAVSDHHSVVARRN